MTYDGQTLKVYHNGELRAQKKVNRERRPGRGHLRLGDRADDRKDYLLPGLIDEVRLYRRALSDEEIKERHRAPAESAPAGCVGYWGFNAEDDTMPPEVRAVLKRAGLRSDIGKP